MSQATRDRGATSASRFKPYPAYKDSGIAWLGEIPVGWSLKRLKRVVRFQGGGTPTKDNIEYWRGEIPWVSPKDMKVSLVLDTEDKITADAIRKSATKLVPAGAVLIVVRSGILVHSIPVALAGCEVTLNQDLKAMIPRSELAPKYLMYLISGMQRELLIEWKKEGATVESLELESVANTPTPLPAIAEQRAIAAVLDRQTARIDALVAKKERLIELLREKRTGLISRAVTKGLDLNVPMKDSGVEWLGEIPAHWEAVRVKHTLLNKISGPFGSSLTKDSYAGSTYRVYGQEQVIPGDFTLGDYYIPESKFRTMKRYAVQAGDVLLSCVGTFGRAAVVPEGIEPGIINPRLILLRPDRSVIVPAYLELFLKSQLSFAQMDEISRGGTMDIINLSMISALSMPLPPKPEQQAILEAVRVEETRIDNLLAEVRDAIDRLKELRTALISAAVTGKIDVREEAA